ncbi:MAG: PAS domain S-box protein [Pseudomonadaceae bacterium]
MDHELAELDAGLQVADLLLHRCPWPLVIGTSENWHVVSRSFATSIGYTRRELESMHWTDVVASTEIQSVKQELLDVEEFMRTTEITIGYRHRKGGQVHVVWSWGPANESGFSVAVGRFV